MAILKCFELIMGRGFHPLNYIIQFKNDQGLPEIEIYIKIKLQFVL